MSGYRTKRPPRPRRDRFEKPAHCDVLAGALRCPTLHEWAEEFEQHDRRTVLGGRPPTHPAIVKLLFGIMAWQWGGVRGAHREIRSPSNWALICEELGLLYPAWACFQPGGRPPTRFQYARFRNKYGLSDDMFASLRDIAETDACAQAQAMGQLTADAGGSLTHPSPARVVSGDGTVLAPRYTGSPDDRQLNPLTGELEPVRHDPDIAWYRTGDGRQVKGHHFVIVETRNDHEDERVLLSVRHQPAGSPGGEAGIALEILEDLRPMLPGLQGVAWDKALRGKHIDRLYNLGLQPVIKVSRRNGKVNTRRIGPHVLDGSGAGIVEVYAENGSIGIKVAVAAETTFVRCTKARTMMRRDRNGFRWYAQYVIPEEAPMPLELRGQRFTVRLNGSTKDDPAGLNRAEVIRPITVEDDEWRDLHAGRPGSESTNEWFKARLPKRRSPALGSKRTRFEMLCMQVFANVRAQLAFDTRTAPDPPN